MLPRYQGFCNSGPTGDFSFFVRLSVCTSLSIWFSGVLHGQYISEPSDFYRFWTPNETRRGRPCWSQTLHRLAPPLCPKKEREKICDTWHLTPETWYVTPDTWQLTRETWHVTCGGGWTFSQIVSYLALMVWVYWFFEDLEEKHHWLNQCLN